MNIEHYRQCVSMKPAFREVIDHPLTISLLDHSESEEK